MKPSLENLIAQLEGFDEIINDAKASYASFIAFQSGEWKQSEAGQHHRIILNELELTGKIIDQLNTKFLNFQIEDELLNS